MNLYEITEQYRAHIENCSEFDPETGEIKSFDINEMEGSLLDKRLAVAGYIKSLEAECEAMMEVSERICERRLKKEKHADYLNNSLLSSMQSTNTDKVEGAELIIKLKTNPPKLIIDNENIIPQKFFKIDRPKPVRYLDKGELKTLLGTGCKIKGAHLEQAKRIEIK